jgi:hypothetical protein
LDFNDFRCEWGTERFAFSFCGVKENVCGVWHEEPNILTLIWRMLGSLITKHLSFKNISWFTFTYKNNVIK